jgi:hypothetical protein
MDVSVKQRWAIFAMGAWIAGNVMVAVVAAENFYTVDRLLAGSTSRVFASEIARVGHAETRDLLRYLSSELNRRYFQLWNVTQLAIGLLVLWLIAPGPATSRPRWGVLGMVGLVALATVWLTPQIISAGRSLDFVPRDPVPSSLRQFWMLHGIYTFLEASKLVVGLVVTIWIARIGQTDEADPDRGVGAPRPTSS